MDLFIDDDQVDAAFVADETLADTLSRVQSELCAPDQLVVGLRCDGHDVPANGMADTLRRPASSFKRLQVFTGTKDILVIDAMEQAATCLAETEEASRHAAELFTEGSTVEAAQMLGDCLRVWQQIHEAVAKSIEMLHLDPERMTVQDEPLLNVIGRPKETLLQIKEALQARDHVLLADILKYEFSDTISHWHLLVSKLRQEAEDLAARRTE